MTSSLGVHRSSTARFHPSSCLRKNPSGVPGCARTPNSPKKEGRTRESKKKIPTADDERPASICSRTTLCRNSHRLDGCSAPLRHNQQRRPCSPLPAAIEVGCISDLNAAVISGVPLTALVFNAHSEIYHLNIRHREQSRFSGKRTTCRGSRGGPTRRVNWCIEPGELDRDGRGWLLIFSKKHWQ